MENPEICSRCKGVCCKAGGAHIFPDELAFDISADSLINLLSKGIYSVDYWGDPPSDLRAGTTRIYYLRYKHTGRAELLDHSKYIPCILLTENGCRLQHDERPRVCRELVPKDDFRCNFENDEFSVISCAVAWQKYQNELLSVLKYYKQI